MTAKVCVIVGIGPKNGDAFARRFDAAGYSVALLSRSTDYSEKLAAELNDARAYSCDASDPESVEEAFGRIVGDLGDVDVLIYNAGAGSWKSVDEMSVTEFEQGWRINALGLLVATQQIIPAMRGRGSGNIVVVGATASLRGRAMTAGFASAKAAQRSLAQSMARHLGPDGIHVSLLIIDGRIDAPAGEAARAGTGLDPRDIAESVFFLTTQPPSAWSFEVDLRPSRETW